MSLIGNHTKWFTVQRANSGAQRKEELIVAWLVLFRTLIPKSFMGLFIGSQGANKKKVEKSTECEISFPDRSKKQGPIGLLPSPRIVEIR